MGQALLFNESLGAEASVLNGIIEKYKSSHDIVSANTFVDFINESEFTYGEVQNLYNSTHVGFIDGINRDDSYGKYYNSNVNNTYYVTFGCHTFQNSVFLLNPTTVLYFHTRSTEQSGYRNYAIMLTIDNNKITLNKAQQLPGIGSNLAAIKLTDTRFFVASGSFRTCTSGGSQIIRYFTLDVNLTDKTYTINTEYHNNRYYYITLSGLFKISDNKVIAFMADGNGGGRYYHTAMTFTIAANGAITLNQHLLQGTYTEQAGNYYYRVFQLSPYKYVEICHYNYPIYTIVTVNQNDNTITRSGYVLPNATASYTNHDYVNMSFTYKDYAYTSYYNGSSWCICSVDCSGSTPAVLNYINFAAPGTNRPIVHRISENQIIALQMNGNLAYATLIKLKDDGTFDSSALTLTVGFRVNNVVNFTQTGEKQGFAVYETVGQTNGLVVFPLSFNEHILTCGKYQIWNDSEAFSLNYTYFRNIREKESICICQNFTYNARNSINCFAIYQNGLDLVRGDIKTIRRDDTYPGNTAELISDIIINEEEGSISLLYRGFELASASYFDLYFTNIFVRGAECYVANPVKVRNGSETSDRNFAYARLIKFDKNNYIALYNYNTDYLSGVKINVNNKLVVTPADKSGKINGWTKTNCTTEKEGEVLIVKAGV